MTQLNALDAASGECGGYKVDVNRGERIGRVSSEGFSRPADERYLSFSDLQAAVRGRAERSRTRMAESAAIRVEAKRGDSERLALKLPAWRGGAPCADPLKFWATHDDGWRALQLFAPAPSTACREQIVFKLDWARHGKAAPFKRHNDQMPSHADRRHRLSRLRHLGQPGRQGSQGRDPGLALHLKRRRLPSKVCIAPAARSAPSNGDWSRPVGTRCEVHRFRLANTHMPRRCRGSGASKSIRSITVAADQPVCSARRSQPAAQ